MIDRSSQKFLIIGAARQGLALARYLAAQGADVTLTDTRAADQLQAEQTSLADLPVKWALGGHPLSLLAGIDWVCPSGGVPLTIPILQAARQRAIPFTNDSQIFLEDAPCKVIGITGSAGKTTTTTLVGRMVAAEIGPEATWVGGNIGNPLIANLGQIQPHHLAVMELSSFQLEIMTCSPQVAAILNITPNHLDRHITMQAYTRAKAQILRDQSESDVAVLGCDDPGAWALRHQIQGGLISFGAGCPPENQPGAFLQDDSIWFWDGTDFHELLSCDQIRLRGQHNLMNVIAAAAITVAAGFQAGIPAGVQDFNGVEHRLEFVAERAGAKWFNDSIATAPERAMAAVRSFDEPLVLLVGGRDKNLPWDAFGALIRERVDHLIIFGDAQNVILAAIGPVKPGERPYTIACCAGLQAAVQAADAVAEAGDIVLLSPGGTSYDEFQDFAERGEWFRKWLKTLP